MGDEGADKEEQLVTAHEELQQLQNDLSASTIRLSAVNDELRESTLSGESKDQTIISLRDELEKYRNAAASENNRGVIMLQQVKKLKEELFASTSQLVELRGLYGAQSRELTAVHEQLETGVLSAETKDHTIEQLEAEVTRRVEQVRASD